MPQYTLSDLETQVYDHLDNNTLFYQQAEVDRAINEAIRVFNSFTGYIQGSVNVTGGTQANRLIYDTPAGILFPISVKLNERQLKKASVRGVSNIHRDWMKHTSARHGPTCHWIPIGISMFAIYPAEVRASKTLTVIGVLEPTTLVSATDVVDLPDENIDCIVDLSVHTLQLKEGGKVFADASVAYQRFIHSMKVVERWKNLKHPRYYVDVASVKAG